MPPGAGKKAAKRAKGGSNASRGPALTPWERHVIRRKWRAGRTAQQIATETNRGLSVIKKLCAQLSSEAGEATAGGGYALVRRRREVTVDVAVMDTVRKLKGGRRRPRTLLEVNAVVRQKPAYRATPYRTTSRDLKMAGGRRVLRSMTVAAARSEMDGGPQASSQEVASDARRALRRAKGVQSGQMT